MSDFGVWFMVSTSCVVLNKNTISTPRFFAAVNSSTTPPAIRFTSTLENALPGPIIIFLELRIMEITCGLAFTFTGLPWLS